MDCIRRILVPTQDEVAVPEVSSMVTLSDLPEGRSRSD